MKNLIYFTIVLSTILFFSCGKNQESSGTIDSVKVADSLNDVIIPKKVVRICTEVLPPPPPSMPIDYAVDTVLLMERQHGITDAVIATTITPTQQYIASLVRFKWQKKNLTVTFLDGDPEVIERVKAVAREWEKVSSIRFTFGDVPNPDISISFLYEGSWSTIGSYSRKVKPSMNFGWLDQETSQEEYNRVVLHEFGHALGFIHEHQNPDANINWNKEAVYRYYMGPPNNWDQDKVNSNIFTKYSRAQTQGTSFDTSSIMLYAIPQEFTLDGFSVGWNNSLSETDKKFVGTLYPLQ